MTNLINGRTPEKIKQSIRICAILDENHDCTHCPRFPDEYTDCSNALLLDALTYIEHLEAKQPKWISVEERLPENEDLVLVRANGRAREIRWDGAYVLATYGSEGWVLWDYEDDEVQHLKILQWVPLPEPPEVST